MGEDLLYCGILSFIYIPYHIIKYGGEYGYDS